MNTAEIGKLGEQLAARYLKKSGYKILEQNKHLSHNEVDIIAADREYILFVEVKTRSASAENGLYLPYGPPSAAVGYKKQQCMLRAAHDYLYRYGANGKQPRMDVIEIYLDKDTRKLLKLNHIPNAFDET